MVGDGLPAATRDEITRALWDRGFEVELYDSYLICELIYEIGVNAEEVIKAARKIGVDEDILQEVIEELAV